eukprot:6176232-Pleurochrysis_carterae.AAC.2
MPDEKHVNDCMRLRAVREEKRIAASCTLRVGVRVWQLSRAPSPAAWAPCAAAATLDVAAAPPCCTCAICGRCLCTSSGRCEGARCLYERRHERARLVVAHTRIRARAIALTEKVHALLQARTCSTRSSRTQPSFG